MKIKPSTDHRLYINNKEINVHKCEVASYALFSARGKLKVEIEVLFSFKKVKIRPLKAGIDYTINGNKLIFNLKAPQKLSLEFDDEILKPLFLLVNPPVDEKPDPDEPGVHYFNSGEIYDVGLVELKENETVYIEEGAVVYGAFTAREANDISIRGRGIIDGSKLHSRDEKPRMFTSIDCKNVTIEGVTWVDGPSWNVVPVACSQVLIKNINVISTVITGDGIDVVGSEDVTINNCFLRTNDDCIAIKAVDYVSKVGCKNVENVYTKNCVLWNAKGGNAIEIGYETRAEEIKDITFENCDVIKCEFEGHQSGGTFTIHNGDRAKISNILYKDIRVEDAREKLIDIKILFSKYSRDEERGQVQNIYFRDIKVVEGLFPVSIIRGYNGEHMVKNVIIENLKVFDRKINNANQAKMVVELANNVEFKY